MRTAWLARVAVLAPAAVLALAGCSPPVYPYAVTVTEWRGAVVVGEGNGYHHDEVADRWRWERLSRDGGRSWRRLTEAETRSVETAATDPVPELGCVPDRPTHCYRVVPGQLRVEETRDGGFTWAISWQVTEGDRDRLARRYRDLGDPAEHLASRALVVDTAGPAGEYVVVVANGRDGYAVRDPAGAWERIGFGVDGHPYFDDPPAAGAGAWLSYPWLWGLVGAVLSLAVTAELLRRGRAAAGRWADKAGLVVLGAGLAFLFTAVRQPYGGEVLVGALAWLAGGLLTVAGLGLWLAMLAGGQVMTRRQWLVAAPAAVLTGGFATLPLQGWLELPAGYPWTGFAGLLIWGAGTTAGATLAWALDRPPAPAPVLADLRHR